VIRLVLATTLAAGGLLAAPPAATAAWTWPLTGEVLTPYRNGDDPYAAGQHRGIDIAGSVGDPVVAALPGLVRFAGVAGSSGLTVSLRSADGRYDLSYLHLSSVAVHRGDTVRAGVPIGAVGTTGTRSTHRPHLHFGVREAGTRHAYIDPLTFLPPPRPVAPRTPQPLPAPVPRPAGPHPAPAPVPMADPLPARGPVLPHVPAPVPTVHGVSRREGAGKEAQAALPVRSTETAGAPRSAASGHVARAAATRRGSLGHAPAVGRLPVREVARPAHPGGEGPDLGWIAACVGLLGTALALSARGERRAAAPSRGLRARLAALVPLLAPRGLRTRE
jgi:hypothetical protein